MIQEEIYAADFIKSAFELKLAEKLLITLSEAKEIAIDKCELMICELNLLLEDRYLNGYGWGVQMIEKRLKLYKKVIKEIDKL